MAGTSYGTAAPTRRLDLPPGVDSSPGFGLLLTVASIVVTEIALRLGADALVSDTFFLSGLVGVAFTTLTAGARWGIVADVLLAVYTLHFASFPLAVAFTVTNLVGVAIIFAIGAALLAVIAWMRAREAVLRAALERRARVLESRNRELVVANAALQSFGDVLAHDLKEPVRGIENYLLAASEEYGTDGGKRYLAEAQRSNQKLATLVDGLLILGETMRSPLHLRPVDLRTVIAGNACRALFEADAERRGATIDVDPGVPLIFGDEYLLSQLLGRVIANAIVHSGTPEPRVRVWGERESGGRARIRIADGGRGFPAPVLERFAKGAGDSLPTPHGGFGLLIASRAAERLGGRMDLENERNGMATAGACVNILLPVPELEDPPRAALATRSGSPTEERPPRSTGSSGARSG